MKRSTLVALVLALLGACDSAPRRPERPPRERPSAAASERPVSTPDPALAKQRALIRLPRLGECRGAMLAGEPTTGGVDVLADSRLELARDGTCEVLYPTGALVRVRGPAAVLLAPNGEGALLVGRGVVTVDLAPGATTPESGFWLATPSAYAEAVQAVRLAVRVMADASSALSVVSGRARVALPGAVAEGDALEAEALSAGQGLLARLAGAEQTITAPARLEDAVAALTRIGEPAAVDLAPRTRERAAQLETSVAALVAHEVRARQLVASHAALVEAGDPAAMAAQREIAGHAAEGIRIKRMARARTATLAAMELAQRGTAPPEAVATLARAWALLH